MWVEVYLATLRRQRVPFLFLSSSCFTMVIAQRLDRFLLMTWWKKKMTIKKNYQSGKPEEENYLRNTRYYPIINA